MFHPASWLAIYAGFNILPESYDPGVDSFETKYISESFATMRNSLKKVVEETATHREFLDTVYGSDEIESREKKYETH